MTRARILADYVAGGTTAAEFDYMDGVTSNVQTQLDAKAPLTGLGFTQGTQVATTSGTSVTFTSIPSTAKYICLIWDAVSLSGSDDILIQIGDSGGIETSGYSSQQGQHYDANLPSATTNGLTLYLHAAFRASIGMSEWYCQDSSTHHWHGRFFSWAADWKSSGVTAKTLSGTLDRISLSSTGSDTFDAGTANIIYI